MAKEKRRCKLRTCKESCLPQQGKMCSITLEIHSELLLLHIAITSQVVLEFLILNFVVILGRCLDIASLYADELVQNHLPLTCFSAMKLEKKIHGTSWSSWCAQDIPAPVGISPSRKPKGEPTSMYLHPLPSLPMQEVLLVQVRKILFISRDNEVTIH